MKTGCQPSSEPKLGVSPIDHKWANYRSPCTVQLASFCLVGMKVHVFKVLIQCVLRITDYKHTQKNRNQSRYNLHRRISTYITRQNTVISVSK